MKKNEKFLDGIVYLNILLLVVFTIVVLIIFYLTGGMEPSALVYAFFAAFGVENGLCAWIYVEKLKRKKEALQASKEESPDTSKEEDPTADDDEGNEADNPEESQVEELLGEDEGGNS